MTKSHYKQPREPLTFALYTPQLVTFHVEHCTYNQAPREEPPEIIFRPS
jgi:hypothetical protein